LFAEVGQLITGNEVQSSFLTPDMASKNDARHGIDQSVLAISGIVFDAMSGVNKLTLFIPAITYPTSAFDPSNGILFQRGK